MVKLFWNRPSLGSPTSKKLRKIRTKVDFLSKVQAAYHKGAMNHAMFKNHSIYIHETDIGPS